MNRYLFAFAMQLLCITLGVYMARLYGFWGILLDALFVAQALLGLCATVMLSQWFSCKCEKIFNVYYVIFLETLLISLVHISAAMWQCSSYALSPLAAVSAGIFFAALSFALLIAAVIAEDLKDSTLDTNKWPP